MDKCKHCNKEVEKGNHQVVLSTLNRPNNKDDHTYFHFVCFVNFWNEGVNKKVRIEVERMRLMANKVLNNPMIKSVVEQIGGGEILNSMLDQSLIKPEVIKIVNKQEVEKKIKNDRKKAGKTKHKSD